MEELGPNTLRPESINSSAIQRYWATRALRRPPRCSGKAPRPPAAARRPHSGRPFEVHTAGLWAAAPSLFGIYAVYLVDTEKGMGWVHGSCRSPIPKMALWPS